MAQITACHDASCCACRRAAILVFDPLSTKSHSDDTHVLPGCHHLALPATAAPSMRSQNPLEMESGHALLTNPELSNTLLDCRTADDTHDAAHKLERRYDEALLGHDVSEPLRFNLQAWQLKPCVVTGPSKPAR